MALYDVQLTSWGVGSGGPTSGSGVIFVGTDNNDRLHIRIFGSSGEKITDTNQTKLPANQAGAISALKQQIQGLLPPYVLEDGDKRGLIGAVKSILGPIISIGGSIGLSNPLDTNGQPITNAYTGTGGVIPMGLVLATGRWQSATDILNGGTMYLLLVPMAQPGQPAPSGSWELALSGFDGRCIWNYTISPIPFGYAGAGTLSLGWPEAPAELDFQAQPPIDLGGNA